MKTRLLPLSFSKIPESHVKKKPKAIVYRIRHQGYETYYWDNIWELYYPEKFTNRKLDIIIDAGGFMKTCGFLMTKKYHGARVYIAANNRVVNFIIKNTVDFAVCTDHNVNSKPAVYPVEKILLRMQTETIREDIFINTCLSYIPA